MGKVATLAAAFRRFVGLLSACRVSACGHRLTAAPTLSEVSDGRLFRYLGLRHVRGHFDALTCFRSLVMSLVVCAVVVFGSVFPRAAHASDFATWSAAQTSCKNIAKQLLNPQNQPAGICTDDPTNCRFIAYYPDGKTVYNTMSYPCNTAPPANPCTANAFPGKPLGLLPGKILSGYQTCKHGVDTGRGDGSTVNCVISTSVTGPPTENQWGSWNTPGTVGATGDVCDGTFSQGSNSWKTGNGGVPPAPVPPSIDAYTPTTPMPKTCGAGSCMDPSTGQFCGSSEGVPVCVSGASARSSAGSCISSGDSTVCAGSPTAPMPPASSNPDAAGSLKNTDTYTQADPVTGANQTVQVNTFTNPGGAAITSGQGSKDTGPASSSSTGGTSCKPGELCNDRYIGAPCDADPSVAGDPLLGAIAQDIHRIRCSSGDGLSASDFDGADRSLGDDHSADEVFVDGSGAGSGGSGDTGLSGLDSSGFLGGHGSCPGFQPIQYLGMNILTSDGICQTGSMLSAFILAMAYAAAALIIARVKTGS